MFGDCCALCVVCWLSLCVVCCLLFALLCGVCCLLADARCSLLMCLVRRPSLVVWFVFVVGCC